MKREEIVSILKELYNVTGFRISLHDDRFNEIAAYPEKKLPLCEFIQRDPHEYARCLECDKESFIKALEGGTTIYRCRHGLTEAVSPLYNFGVLTGFLMMGQIICTDDEEDAKELIHGICTDGATAEEYLALTPKVKRELVESYVKIMTICAQYLTLSNAMQSERRGVAQNAKLYVELNLGNKLTIEDICEKVCCSRSTLTSAFRREFGMSVNEFITDRRLCRACEMLTTNKYAIGEVAQATGFYDQSYFSKVFTAKYGVTPGEYKRKGAL